MVTSALVSPLQLPLSLLLQKVCYDDCASSLLLFPVCTDEYSPYNTVIVTISGVVCLAFRFKIQKLPKNFSRDCSCSFFHG